MSWILNDRSCSTRLFLVLCTMCVLSHAVYAESSEELRFSQKYFSDWNKIHYRFPKGWVVWEEGMSDWLAPVDDKFFWNPGFDETVDPYYTVSAIFPYLTLDDMQAKRVRSLQDIADATLHSLSVSTGATATGMPEPLELGGMPAISIFVEMDGTHSHYQVFVQIADAEVATVAGNGPHNKIGEIRSVVNGVAATIKSGAAK